MGTPVKEVGTSTAMLGLTMSTLMERVKVIVIVVDVVKAVIAIEPGAKTGFGYMKTCEATDSVS